MSDTQAELHAFLDDPETFKRAAEESMAKRQAVLDQAELDEILDQYLDSQWNGNMRDAILDWHNKQVDQTYDDLKSELWVYCDEYPDADIHDVFGYIAGVQGRNKLKEVK